jgi:hypothetical protein
MMQGSLALIHCNTRTLLLGRYQAFNRHKNTANSTRKRYLGGPSIKYNRLCNVLYNICLRLSDWREILGQ